MIVNATEQLSKLYDHLYEEADKLLKLYNPCKVRVTGKCVSCIEKREYAKNNIPYDYGNQLCCIGCKHLKEKGCSVKALTCKLWLCATAAANNPELNIKLKELHTEHIIAGFSGPRMSKEEVFKIIHITIIR